MGRIEETFATLAGAKRKALVAYLCVGDPSVDESVELAVACVEAGADILELGVPFSDPSADGPAIARASERAIAHGGGLIATLRAAKAIRARVKSAPIVLFGYFNPLFVRGETRVVADAVEAGIDAFLVVDLPAEEGDVFRAAATAQGVAIVPLLAPTSSPARVEGLKRGSRPAFIYYVSVTGVTGAAAAPLVAASEQAGALRRSLGAPIVVGFGIDSPEKARDAATHADGVVVGTALVRAIEEGGTPALRRKAAGDLVHSLRTALDRP